MKSEIQISKQQILPLQIIAISLLAGPTLFLIVTIYISTMGNAASTNRAGILQILTPVAVGMSILISLISPYIQKFATMNAGGQSGSVLNSIQKIQTGLIIRYALSEGPALFGIIVIFLALQSQSYPMYVWANLIPLAILYAVVVWTFPTKESVLVKINEMSVEN